MDSLSKEPSSQDPLKISMERFDVIKQFYFQICSIPALVQQAIIDGQPLSEQFQGLEACADTIIEQFKQQQATLLEQFDSLLMPLAKEVLDELLGHAKSLKLQLSETLSNLPQMASLDWTEHAQCWVQLYSKWYDYQELRQKVLRLASDRTSQLIDKDIRVIQDYQSQSLSRMDLQGEVFKHIENRLAKAIEGPLKQLADLKTGVKEDLSLKQASEWIAQLHKQRETCFDQLLMKIDSIVKDVVLVEEEHEEGTFKELEEEGHFVERELLSIHKLLPHLHKEELKEVYFAEMRLESLREHLDQFDLTRVPKALKDRLLRLYHTIDLALLHIREFLKNFQ